LSLAVLKVEFDLSILQNALQCRRLYLMAVFQSRQTGVQRADIFYNRFKAKFSIGKIVCPLAYVYG